MGTTVRDAPSQKPPAAGRVCARCGLWKPATEFHTLPSGSLYSYCRECQRARVRDKYGADPALALQKAHDWRERNPERYQRNVHRNNLKRAAKRMGVSIEEILSLLADSDGCCSVCGGVSGPKRLSIDHDHEARRLRGLLCNNCNVGIGYFADNPEMLRRAAAYLEKANGHHSH